MISNRLPCGVTNLATSRNGNDSNEELRVFSGAEYSWVGGVGDGFLGGAPYNVDGGVGDGFFGKLYKLEGRWCVFVDASIYERTYVICV